MSSCCLSLLLMLLSLVCVVVAVVVAGNGPSSAASRVPEQKVQIIKYETESQLRLQHRLRLCELLQLPFCSRVVVPPVET